MQGGDRRKASINNDDSCGLYLSGDAGRGPEGHMEGEHMDVVRYQIVEYPGHPHVQTLCLAFQLVPQLLECTEHSKMVTLLYN